MARDNMIKDFDLNAVEEEVLKERLISIRVPEEYKMKYDTIQSRSRRRFADYLRDLFIKAIDRVDLDNAG